MNPSDEEEARKAKEFYLKHGAWPAAYIQEVLGDPTVGVTGPVKDPKPKESLGYRCCMCHEPIMGKEGDDWVWLSAERLAHIGCYTPEE